MTRRIPAKTAKTARKSRPDILQSPQMLRAVQRVAVVADKAGRRDEATQRQARAAIADTIEGWLDWLAEEDPQAVEDFYVEIELLATAALRKRIAKHALRPEGVEDRVQLELEKRKEEEEAARKADPAEPTPAAD